MPSEVAICNGALVKLGNENIIASLTEAGREAETCNLLYTQVRDALLQEHPWNFAIGRKTLSQDGSSPAFEFDNAFQLPSDCLRALMLFDSDERWKVEGSLLVTDASTAKLIYIKKITDPAKFTPLFTELLKTRLAHELCEVITGSTVKKSELAKELKALTREARRRDGQEGTPENINANGFISGYKYSTQWWRR